MSTLDELTDELQTIDTLLMEQDGEITPEIEAWMQEYGDALLAKVDRVAFYLLGCEDRAKVLDQHIADFKRKAQVERRKAEAIKRYVNLQMLKLDTKRLEGTVYTFSLQRNGGKLPLILMVPPEALPEAFVERKEVVTPNNEALRAAIEAGEVDETIAKFGERGESLRLR